MATSNNNIHLMSICLCERAAAERYILGRAVVRIGSDSVPLAV